MFNPLQLIIKACTGLQGGFFNMNFYSLQHNLTAQYTSKNIDFRSQEQKGEWIGGKVKGSVKDNGEEILIKINKEIIKLRVNDFPSKNNALVQANNLLYEASKKAGTLVNEIRYNTLDSDTYLEVKVNDLIISVDVQAKDLIEKYEWHFDKTANTVYRKEGKKKISLEQDLTNSPIKSAVVKIDGNHLNYRFHNLKAVNQ